MNVVQDMAAVYCVNSKETNNVCHDKHGGYESIEEIVALQTPSLDLLESIDSVQCNSNGNDGDVMDALLVAAEVLIGFCGTKKYKFSGPVYIDG